MKKIKYIKRQDSGFKLSYGNSGETSLNLSNEIFNFISQGELSSGEEKEVTFKIYKEDCIKAMSFVIMKLPLYKSSSNFSNKVDNNLEIFGELYSKIESFFGINKDTEYKVCLFYRPDGRIYLKGLRVNGFSIRDYLVENYSALQFDNEEGDVLNLRILSDIEDNGEYEGEDTFGSEDVNVKPLQQIFYGAPGTGKSFAIKKETEGRAVVRTTFHPDSDYSTFVGAYKPTSVEVPVMTIIGKEQVPVENAKPEKKIVYDFVPQAFLKAYTGAWKNQNEPFFLIIEEINRGNCAQIFGDLFQLLDRNDETGLSDYPISPDEDIQKFLLTDRKFGFAELTEEQKAAIPEEVQSGELLILPKNLYIWATMNTSDQSLFPIDSAFKRRWDWQYIPISNGNKGWQIEVKGARYDWWDFLEKMNDKISSTTHSEDKKLGYYFCKTKDGIIDAKTFVGKVIFYVWNDVFKDFAEEAGDLFKDENGDLLSYDKFYGVGADGKTKVLEDKVVLFLEHLGLEAYNGEDEEIVDDSEPGSRRTLNVDFGDETIAIKRFPQYLQVLQKIGLDKVESVASEKQVDVLGAALVSKLREDTIENSQYTYVECDGYYVVKGIKGSVMIKFLPLISDKYNLDLKIAYK